MDAQSIRKGITVCDRHGRKVGEIIACGLGSFVVGTGVAATPEYAVRHADIAEMRDGEIVIGRGLEELRRRDEADGPPMPK